MISKCNYCTNKKQCSECDANQKDKFVPSDEVKDYFERVYIGARGINGYVYSFNTTNESLIATHSIRIGSNHYCPYCGEIMHLIQDEKTLAVIGHCCICQGARDEIEFEKRKKTLEKKQKEEMDALKSEYSNRLSFCTDKLFDIKQKQERNDFEFFSHEYNHFSTLNGETYQTIEQIV